ncbi:hypothetical protein LTR56_020403 [Elasticomyces elasticus]|nr:hypothetical protein LTR56_020403 [Elasticomyces elasticus]KAK3666507.1 hypothetical protein LTR22_002812 [Elasticomyces elasticus]KAK4931327.1 hypothetical protein LTR49_002385 [Elasticomyces elasticus]KAK5767741.1 hypothetical protein LTS12_001893 [Elasticomyces elasticus]
MDLVSSSIVMWRVVLETALLAGRSTVRRSPRRTELEMQHNEMCNELVISGTATVANALLESIAKMCFRPPWLRTALPPRQVASHLITLTGHADYSEVRPSGVEFVSFDAQGRATSKCWDGRVLLMCGYIGLLSSLKGHGCVRREDVDDQRRA